MATRLNFSLNSYHNNKSQRERERERERVFDGYGFHVEISRNPIFLSLKKKNNYCKCFEYDTEFYFLF